MYDDQNHKGNFVVRLGPDLYIRAKNKAKNKNLSLNAYIRSLVSKDTLNEESQYEIVNSVILMMTRLKALINQDDEV